MNNFQKLNKILLLIILFYLIQSCASVQKSIITKDPSLFPVKRKTILTNELACFGDMLSEYRFVRGSDSVKPLQISIVSVTDETNISEDFSREIPKNIIDLAIGVASNIGGPLRIAHIPNNQEIHNAYLLAFAKIDYLGNFRFKHYNSEIMLYGAITEYDRVTENDKKTLNLGMNIGKGSGESDINISRSKISMLARMTMDFRVIFTITRNVVNHASSTNTVYLHQNGQDYSYGISFDGQAIGQAVSLTEVDARHAAIRILTELGLMESIGKYELIPYWKCFPQNNEEQTVKINNIENNKLQGTENNLDIINKKKMDFEYGDYLSYPGKDFSESFLEYLPRQTNDINFGYFLIKHGDFSKVFQLSTTNEKQGCVKLKSVLKMDEFECNLEKTYTIAGKKEKISRILNLYRKNITKFNQTDDEHILKELHTEFVNRGIIKAEDENLGSNMYLALWFNAPIKKLARWQN